MAVLVPPIRSFVVFAAIFAAVAVFIFAIPLVATASTMLPYNTYLASDWSDIHTKLDGKDGIIAPATIYVKTFGDVWDAPGHMAPNAFRRAWVIDSGWQVVGVVDFYFSVYTFYDGYGIFGNSDLSPEDDGAEGGDILKLAVLNLDTGCYYLGSFITGPLATDGYTLEAVDRECNIEVTSTVIPEPATLTLLSIGGIGMLLRRCRRGSP